MTPPFHSRRPGAGGRGSRGGPIAAALLALALMPQLAGCYHQVPAAASAMPPGADVRVAIAEIGRVAMGEPVGPGARALRGSVVETGDTSLVLAVTAVEYLELAVPVRWAGERVEIPFAFVGEVQERRLSRPRTLLMTGLVSAAAVAAAFLPIRGFGPQTGGGRPGNGDDDPQ